MCQMAQAQAKFGAFASRRSKSGGEFFQDGEAVFIFFAGSRVAFGLAFL